MFMLLRVKICRHAPQLVRRVVRDVLERLGRPALHVAHMPVDLQRKAADIKQQLAWLVSASGTAVLGLHGMGGIGKTTLASALYNDLRAEFVDASCFVEVGRDAKRQQLQQRQEQMLRELCGVSRTVSSLRAGRAELENRLSTACVLLVIDDIWSTAQLDEMLVGVGQGSCVLVTTRNRAVFGRRVALQWPVDGLDKDASLELFCWHAFLQRQPPAGYEDLAADFAQACSGLPLALTVTGAHLWSKPTSQTWKDALRRLQDAMPFDGNSYADDALWGTLRVSYDDLASEEQQMFLDISCIMLGKDRMMCLPAWGNLAYSTLENLKNRSLVSVDSADRLAVHDQLRDMGRAIVMREGRSAGQRSRVWMPEAHTLMQKKQVSPWLLPMYLFAQLGYTLYM